MRASQFSDGSGGIDKHLKLNNSAPLPPNAKSLGKDEVLVKVLSASLNPIDFKLAEPFLFRRIAYGANATPATDFAGHVVSTGPNSGKISTQDLKPGQLVFGRLNGPTTYGALAEYTVAPRVGCVPVPDGVKPDDAASIGTAALTAYQSIAPYVKAGDRVFINGGSGGVGVYTVQFAKALGCYAVTTCSTANVDLCKSLGADEVIDYRTQDVLKTLQKSQQFDHVIDNVSSPAEIYWQAHTFTKPSALYIQVGAGLSLPAFYDLLTRFTWPGFLGGSKRSFKFLGLESKAEELTRIANWMAEGKVKAAIDETFDMDDKGAARAYQKLKTGRAKGKIVVRVAKN